MAELLREEISIAAQRMVVKVGTRVLTHTDGTLNDTRIAQLAEELSVLCDAGRQTVLVSSGAVSAGVSQLGLKQRPTDLAQLQAVAAVGQTKLIEAYDRTFEAVHQAIVGRRAGAPDPAAAHLKVELLVPREDLLAAYAVLERAGVVRVTLQGAPPPTAAERPPPTPSR